ncbi:MAG: F0F1 ATP synthase subunit delta [Kiritimatiellae bacterium]|nr:F0F1 ATP synthase subunit delta [Kiritimatiellia bacterium]
MDILKILAPVIVGHLVVLVAVVLVIRRLLLGDTMRAIKRIEQVEAEVRAKEQGIRAQIEENEREFARKKAEAEEELQRQKEESEKAVARMREQVLADARKEAERIVAQARRNEQKIRDQIAQDMEEKAVRYAGEIFRLVFSERMTSELNNIFTNELLDALAELDTSNVTVDADTAEFISSHPLYADQKQRLEKLLADKFGVNIKVNEKIREDLLAGLVFKLGSLEIDGSLLNRYREAAAEVAKQARAGV